MVKDEKVEESVVNFLVDDFTSKCGLTDFIISSHPYDGSCGCIWPESSVVHSGILRDEDLKVPIVAAPFLAVHFHDEVNCDQDVTDVMNDLPYASQDGPVMSAILIDRKKLTKEGATKDKYEITVDFEGSNVAYEPGDAFCFIVPNVAEEVKWILHRLKLDHLATKQCKVTLLEGTTKKNAKIPLHLKHQSSLWYIFSNIVDIRRVVSKALLRYLADASTVSSEKRRLLELTSVQGASEYEEFVVKPALSILDILHAFPSCMPSLERMLEYLPQLQPRPYSIASYDSSMKSRINRARFVYTHEVIPASHGRFYNRNGLTTGWLTKLGIGSQIRTFFRRPGKFRLLREHIECPLILIASGTGIAPYMAFLELVMEEIRQDPTLRPNTWLIFGCKNEKLDFLYQDELQTFHSAGVLSRRNVAFSRDDDSRFHYVQDIIRHYGDSISQSLLTDNRLRIYVCGDARSLAQDVWKAFQDTLSEHAGKTKTEAAEVLRKMQLDSRYLLDVWV